MTQKTALIVGATSDLARALAHQFAAAGWALQLAARNESAVADDAQDLRLRYGAEVSTFTLDVTDIPQVSGFMDTLPVLPEVVVSVVGFMPEQASTTEDAALAARVVATNFTGPVLLLERAARKLAAAGKAATVIGVSSVAGDRGRAKNYWYGAAKAGFTAALSGLRQQYARSSVRVMTVRPGFIATRMTAGMALPPALTLSAEQMAALIFRGWQKGRRVVVPFRWWLIMLIIVHIPERIFEKMKF